VARVDDETKKFGTYSNVTLAEGMEGCHNAYHWDGVYEQHSHFVGGGVMTIPDLIIKLNNDDPMRRAAAGELLKIGAPAIEPLILALQEKPWNVRFSARWVLGRLGPDAINPLIQAMSSSNNQDVLAGAASALGDIGNNRAVDVLIKSIGHQNLRLPEFRIALGKLKDERSIPALILDLESNSLSRNEATIDALVSFGTSAIDPLIHELDVNGKFKCLSAALALGKLKAVDAIDPLIMILRDSTTDDPLYDAILPKQKQLGISSAAATALGLIGGSRVILPLISATKDKREKVRKCAIDALGETSDSRVFDILIEVLGDTSDEVRRAAILALGKLGDPRGIEPVLNLLIKGNDKEKICGSSAIRNLLISHSDGRVIPVLKKLYKESPNIRENTGVALGLAGDQEIRDICINNLSGFLV
jgi:HEAT repeat protein